MKCPNCGAELVKLPKNPKRQRCDNCKSVYDTAQLERLFGPKAGDKVHAGTLPFETQHMHEKHQAEGGAGSGYSMNSASSSDVFIKSGPAATISNLFQGEDISKTASHMISRSQAQYQQLPVQQPQFSRPVPQRPNQQQNSNVIKFVIIFMVLFFVVPVLFSMIGVLATVFSDSGPSSNTNSNYSNRNYTYQNYSTNINKNSNTAQNANSASNVNTSSTSDGRTFIPGTSETVLYDMSISLEPQYAKSMNGADTFIIGVNWTNPSKYDSSTYTSVKISVFQDGREVDEIFVPRYADDVQFDANNKFDNAKPGTAGFGQYSFRIDLEKPITVQVYSGDDTFFYDNPPYETFEYVLEKQGDGYIVKQVN